MLYDVHELYIILFNLKKKRDKTDNGHIAGARVWLLGRALCMCIYWTKVDDALIPTSQV